MAEEKASPMEQDWLNVQLAKNKDKFLIDKELSLYCGTWNVNGKSPKKTDLSPWLMPLQKPDIYVLGFQEIVDLGVGNVVLDANNTLAWSDAIKRSIGDDFLFWLGDLNYRLNFDDFDLVFDKIKQKDYRFLLSQDQLCIERKARRAFGGFVEPPINFPPTYKFEPGSDRYEKRPDKKKRMPAWNQEGVTCTLYGSTQQPNISDHKPVHGVFTLIIKEKDFEAERKIKNKLRLEMDHWENQQLPNLSLSVNELNFGKVSFEEPKSIYTEVENKGKRGVNFSFIPRAGQKLYCKKFVRIDPFHGMLLPGEKMKVKVTVMINRETSSYIIEEDECVFDDILVLRAENGKADRFLTINGLYVPSSFGSNLEFLSRCTVPIASLAPDQSGVKNSVIKKMVESPNSLMPIPKELWELVNYLYLHGKEENGIFLTNGDRSEMNQVKYCLDHGYPFHKKEDFPHGYIPQEEEKDAPGKVFSPHSVAHCLIEFLYKLRDPVFPHSVSQQFIPGETNISTWYKEALYQLPLCQYNSFIYLVSFLRELLKYKNSNSLTVSIQTAVYSANQKPKQSYQLLAADYVFEFSTLPVLFGLFRPRMTKDGKNSLDIPVGDMEYRAFDHEDGGMELKPSLESHASWWSLVTFSWLSPLFSEGYKKGKLDYPDFWGMIEGEDAKSLLDRFNIYYEGQYDHYQENKHIEEKERRHERLQERRSKRIKAAFSDHPSESQQLLLNSSDPITADEEYVDTIPAACENVEEDEAGKKTEKEIEPTRFFSLFWGILVPAYFKPWMAAGFMKFLYDITQFIQPLLLNQMITFITNIAQQGGDGPTKVWYGYAIASLMFCNALFGTTLLHQYFHRVFRTGMHVRVGLSNKIYQKSLCMSPSARTRRTQGQTLNLLSTDAQRIADSLPYSHIIWSGPFQITVAVILLYRYIEWAVFVGLAVMIFVMMPLNMLIMRYLKAAQKDIMAIKDVRIKVTNETISAMKVLKLYAWELQFGSKISDIREEEIQKLRRYVYLSIATSMSWMITPVLISLTSFAAFVWWSDEELTAARCFTALSLFDLLRFPLAVFPSIIAGVIEAKVSVRRLTDFFIDSELDNAFLIRHKESDKEEHSVKVSRSDFFWDDCLRHRALTDLEFNLRKASLTMVVGRTGSGKSALLNALIGDLCGTPDSRVSIYGSVAYCSQVAWIQNLTVRENILFGKAFDREWYDRVIYACCLTQDLEILQAGDQTEIGEKGINLSGGQKQRIALARAVYQNASIYFFDDVLSAVDSHVGAHIFENCISGLLKDKTVLFCTNQIQYLSKADNVMYLNQSKMEFFGPYAEFSKKDYDLPTINHHEESAEEEDLKEVEAPKLKKQLSLNAIEKVEKKEQAQKEEGKIMIEAKRDKGHVSWDVYQKYIDASGGTTRFALLVLCICAAIATSAVISRWLAEWSNNVDEGLVGPDQKHNNGYYLAIYGLLAIGQVVITGIGLLYFAQARLEASETLHNNLLKKVLRAPMSFFDTTPTGRIINRFTKDIYTLDEKLPSAILSYLRTIISVTITLFVIILITPLFGIILVPLLFFYYFTQEYYIQTQRDVKRVMSVMLSPVFSHFGETLSGVTTLRAFQIEDKFSKKNEECLDAHMKLNYPNFAGNRWLAVRLEFVGTFIVFGAALFAVVQRNTLTAGLAGMSISYALSVTQYLNWMVRMTSDRETNIVSVERIHQYIDIDQEKSLRIKKTAPPKGWPDRSEIDFQNVEMRYREGLPLVLRGLNFHVNEKEKVGIVGRTGAGKSTIFLTLLRMVEPAGGSIQIDGTDVETLGLHDLRTRFAAIPQDPVLFTGSVRFNLDPFKAYSDAELWDALELAHLKSHIKTLRDGLDHEVEEGGANFSVGQRQLLCLARALLRDSKILLLDEATSAVDVKTDELVQGTIKDAFKDYTVLTIAHRLDTVMDSDRILVMDAGKVAEFDTPQKLLQNEDSVFRSIAVKAFGTELINKIAENGWDPEEYYRSEPIVQEEDECREDS